MKAKLKPCKKQQFIERMDRVKNDHPTYRDRYDEYVDYITDSIFDVVYSTDNDDEDIIGLWYDTDFKLDELTVMSIRQEECLLIKEKQ